MIATNILDVDYRWAVLGLIVDSLATSNSSLITSVLYMCTVVRAQ